MFSVPAILSVSGTSSCSALLCRCELAEFRCFANEAFVIMDFERCNMVVGKDTSSEPSVAIYTGASQNVQEE